MAITTQQIHAIADQLHEQGIKPTLAEVLNAYKRLVRICGRRPLILPMIVWLKNGRL